VFGQGQGCLSPLFLSVYVHCLLRSCGGGMGIKKKDLPGAFQISRSGREDKHP
jgi:hypothetical protein